MKLLEYYWDPLGWNNFEKKKLGEINFLENHEKDDFLIIVQVCIYDLQ